MPLWTSSHTWHDCRLEVCGNGFQYSQSLPFPRGHSHSHSRNLCLVRPIPIPWTCTDVFSWVLSPGRHPSFWHAISWYVDARRSADKNCTMWQIICRRRPTHLEQLASGHSWPDTVSRNICNTAENLLVCLMAAAPVFLNWRLRNVQYDMIWYDMIPALFPKTHSHSLPFPFPPTAKSRI